MNGVMIVHRRPALAGIGPGVLGIVAFRLVAARRAISIVAHLRRRRVSSYRRSNHPPRRRPLRGWLRHGGVGRDDCDRRGENRRIVRHMIGVAKQQLREALLAALTNLDEPEIPAVQPRKRRRAAG